MQIKIFISLSRIWSGLAVIVMIEGVIVKVVGIREVKYQVWLV